MNVVPLRRNLFLSKSNAGRKSRDLLIVNGMVLYNLLPVVVEATPDFRISKQTSIFDLKICKI